MSIPEQIRELQEQEDAERIAEYIASQTIPGRDNDAIIKGLGNARQVVPQVIKDLNNWFEVVDVRILDSDHIGLPMRYRWSIIRWSNQDMDHWLEENGWADMAHLNADSKTRQENELEARYRKQFGNVVVDCNFLVYFPPEVFEKLNENTFKSIERKNKRRHTIEQVVEARRNNDVE